jgi:isopentenyl phosphate kinase
MSIIFLKLGGSLITDKTRAYTARLDTLADLAGQIASVLGAHPDLRLVLGHGSGSFGHTAASQFDTRSGVKSPEDWKGFSEVWFQASALNRLVVMALRQAGLPAITLSPAASITACDGKVAAWDLRPLHQALSNGLLPVIHGDVVFDEGRGGTILSTEELFSHLAPEFHPERILLAGLEEAVWADFPARTHGLAEIVPADLSSQAGGLKGAAGLDVTGGMASKVALMLELVEQNPGLEVLIFSGEKPGNVHLALEGGNPGTRLHR